MSIFKAYDIRGIYPEEFNENKAYLIGLAIAEFIKPETVVIGRDARDSSEDICSALISSLTDKECKLINLNLVSTPILYHYAGSNKLPLGLMVTASHNASNFNGIKICQNGAKPISPEQISTIGKMVEELERKSSSPFLDSNDTSTNIMDIDPYPEYIKVVHGLASFNKGFKIAIDTANAISGMVIPKVFNELPVDIIPLYFELDGKFPNHQPDPLKKENTIDLQNKVVENGCQIGAAIDGDGDRVMFIDEKGAYVPADMATLLIALDLHEKQLLPKKIVIDTRMSKAVIEILRNYGVEAVRGRVGHSFVKAKIHEINAFFAGELSGHYYFRENYYAESSDLAIVSMLNILSRLKKPLSELVRENNIYFHSGEINFKASNKQEVMDNMCDKFHDGQASFIDGITIEYPHWWMNVRPSNTEDILRLNMEAKTKTELNTCLEKVSDFITKMSK